MKILSEKEGGFYNNKILAIFVLMLTIALLAIFVFGTEGVAVTLSLPTNNSNISTLDAITFNCTPIALNVSNDNVTNVTLWHNLTGTFSANETKIASNMNNTNVTFTKTPSADGFYVWNCRAYDNLSVANFSSSNYTLIIDTTAPVINQVNLSSSLVKTGYTKINVTINVTDTTTGVKNVTVNGVSISRDGVSTDTWSILMNISQRPLVVIATDYVSFSDTNNTVTVSVDNTAPTTTFANDSNINSSTWYNTNLSLALSAVDTGGSNVNMTEYRNGTSGGWTVWTSNLTFTFNLTSNTFQFRSNDSLNNREGYQTRTIKIDRTAPSVTINALTSTNIGLSEGITLSATITDVLSGLNADTLTAWHNGTGGHNASNKQTLTLQNGKYIGTLTGPSSVGSYIVTVNATDNAGTGNSATDTSVFVSTVSVPTIRANVSNNTYVANLSVIGFTITGANYTFYNTSASFAFSTPNSTTDISVIVNATTPTFIVEIHANGSSWGSNDNVTNKTYQYLVDNVIPSVLFSGISANQVINGTTTITALSSDAASGTAYVKFYTSKVGETLSNELTDTVSPYSYDWNTVTSADGNYTLNITAVDNVGNINSTQIYVTINNSRPLTQAVSSGIADFAGTILENQVPQITGLNSSNTIVTVSKGDTPFISGESGNALVSTKLYLNISADTAATSTVYFKLTTSQISFSDRNNIGVYMDHDEDGAYEASADATYINQIGDYYNFYFTTTSFSIFAIGTKVSTSPNTGGSSSGGGSSASTTSIRFTPTPITTGLKVDDKATFVFNGVTQSIKAIKVVASSATFRISPSGQNVELNKGESVELDLDGDNHKDMRLTLDYVSGGNKAFIMVKKLPVKAAAPTTPVAEPETEVEPEVPAEEVTPPTTEPEKEIVAKKKPLTPIIIAAAIILIVVIVGISLSKKKK